MNTGNKLFFFSFKLYYPNIKITVRQCNSLGCVQTDCPSGALQFRDLTSVKRFHETEALRCVKFKKFYSKG